MQLKLASIYIKAAVYHLDRNVPNCIPVPNDNPRDFDIQEINIVVSF